MRNTKAEVYSKFYENQDKRQSSNASQTGNASAQSNSKTIFKQQRQQESEEVKKTEEALKSNPYNFDAEGNHLAPNGKKSNLTYRQWVQVRTDSFKNWFGDWQTVSDDFNHRLNHIIDELNNYSLKSDLPIDWSVDEKGLKAMITNDSKRNRGKVFCSALGICINFNRETVKEVLHHDYRNEAHLASIYSIPEFIKNGKLLANVHDGVNNRDFTYLLSKFNYKGNEYIVRSSIRRNGDSYYYDHKLSSFDKFEELIDGLLVTSKDHPSSLLRNLDAKEPAPLSNSEDKRLISILQGFSKVLDENGEPLVVKHGSQVLWDDFDMNEARQNSDIVGAFFSSADEEAETYGYGGYVRDFFLNIKNPAPYEYAYEIFRENQRKELAGAITRERLFSEGYDGVIYKEDGENDEYIVFNNTDLKSATDNNGYFSYENQNIFAQQKLTPEEQVAEKAERIDNTYTFSDFAETDVENMRSAPFYYYMFSKDAVMLCC